jgi:hypothetical protein
MLSREEGVEIPKRGRRNTFSRLEALQLFLGSLGGLHLFTESDFAP